MTLWTTLDRLFQSGIKTPVALSATAACATKRGARRFFFVDSLGRWVNRQAAATFVSPTVHAVRYSDLREHVLDYWCAGYRPGPGDTVVDIGAGIGEETVVFSHLVGETGRVLAIEAHPHTFAALSETIRRSKLANVIPLQCAITDQDGTICISDTIDHFANTVILGGGGKGEVKVPARTLASLCADLGISSVDFLKMNIEGAERLAVKGLGNLTISHMAISCHDFVADDGGSESFRTKAEVRSWLAAQGYEVTQRDVVRFPCDKDTLYVEKCGPAQASPAAKGEYAQRL
jgi:FkbM family methyltransferase